MVVADGFYEWVKDGKKSIPYRITMKDGGLFAFAGLWDRWKRPDGKDVETFSLITTDPNELMRPLHDRMPVILARENEGLWLSPDVTEKRTIFPLLKPYPPDNMKMFRVSERVNSARNKEPGLIADIESGPSS